MNNSNHSASYAATLLRVSLGTMFVAHALLKILVFTPQGTAEFFASLGVPGMLAYPTIGAELIGGLLLLVGYQTRLVSLLLIPVLVGAIALVHGSSGWLFSNQGGGWEYPLFLIATCVVQALLGDGAYSIGNLRQENSKASFTGKQPA